MRPPANAIGGDTRPLAAIINPMKNTFLDTYPVFLKNASSSKQKYSCPICESYGPRRFWLPNLERRSLQACACGDKPAEFKGHALRLGARCIDNKELALDTQPFEINNLRSEERRVGQEKAA